MTAQELLRKIAKIPISITGLSRELLAGDFSSVFKGQGMEFDEIRHYQFGDDIRTIDWNTSARFGTPFVKMYREEKELTVMILLDVSASMRRKNFIRYALQEPSVRSEPIKQANARKSQGEEKNPFEQGVLASALIAFSAERTGQRVGAVFFDSDIERVFPPRKGGQHIMAFLSFAIGYLNDEERRGKSGSNIASALTAVRKMLKRRSLIVLISDFYSVNWEHELADLCANHDCVAIRISDPAETKMSDIGLICMEDPETGLRIEVPSAAPSFQEAWINWHRERASLWAGLCKKRGAASLELPVTADPASELQKFFGSRSARKRL
jgi:uncharacterized protein (DUF58 family)